MIDRARKTWYNAGVREDHARRIGFSIVAEKPVRGGADPCTKVSRRESDDR